jgi:ribosomal protein L37AE/L43A
VSTLAGHIVHDIVIALSTLALVAFVFALRSAISIKVEDVGQVTSRPSRMACPNCGSAAVVRIDEELVRCQACGWRTDVYEAMKAAGL